MLANFKLGVKYCPGCNKKKTPGDFHGNQGAGDGLATQCKSCSAERTQRWREDNREREREKHFVKKFGMTLAQRHVMLAAQGGVCAICGADRPGGKGDWHTDHNHITSKVRGLLCYQCNCLIGNAKDNINTLRSAIRYLTRGVSDV